MCAMMDQQASVSCTASNDAYTVNESFTQIDLPFRIQRKISTVPCDSATWHTDKSKQDASATSCKICQNSIPISNMSDNMLTYMHIYEDIAYI